MTEIVVLCPTRENPEGAAEMVASLRATQTRQLTDVVLVIDEDEPRAEAYRAIPDTELMVVPGGSLTKATNEAVRQLWDEDVIFGHVGDDHYFKTAGWDEDIRAALLATPGVAYAHDGFPTYWASMWFTNAVIPRTLGWLALPGTYHLAIDDVFMDIGAALPSLHYLGQHFIQHKHPMSGLVAERPIVASHYTRAKRAHEMSVYLDYMEQDFEGDIGRLRSVLGLPDAPIPEHPGKKYRKALYFQLHPAPPDKRTRVPEPKIR